MALFHSQMRLRMINTHYHNSNLIWRTVSRRVNEVIPSDHPRGTGPGVASSIPARSHTFLEIDHEIISTVILLPSAESFMKGCCQLQAKVCAQITG